MALPSKSLDKVSIQFKELQEACDNASLKFGKMVGAFKKKPLDPKDLDKAIDHLMKNPDSMQMAVKASKSAPKFFSTILNKPEIVPGSVVITSENGELMKVEAVDYKTGEVTITASDYMSGFKLGMDFGNEHPEPEKPYLVEICSADLQYTLDDEGRWLHPDLDVFLEVKSLTYRGYCPHCKHEWGVFKDQLIQFSYDYCNDTNQLPGKVPVDEFMSAYIVWKNLKPCA